MSVGKNNQGRYYYSVRYTDGEGRIKQRKVESVEWKSKREALRAEHEFLISLSQLHIVDPTYNELYEHYLSYRKNRIKERSIQTYMDAHTYQILPEFGKSLVSKITKDQIRRWQRKLMNKGYSNSYLITIQAVFKRVLIWGERNDYISKNPFTIEYLRLTKVKHEMDYFTLEEFNRFMSVIDDDVDALIFKTLYWCGLRKGELQALTIDDIDFKTGSLHVRHNYDYRNHILTTPKNINSSREVMMTTQLINDFKEHIHNLSKYAGYTSSRFLFGFDKPLSSTTLERKKNLYCKLAKVKQIRIHEFRHSHVSLLINNGVSDFDISKRLGHSRDMVNNTYGHWFKENQIKIADKLNMMNTVYKNEATLKN